MDYYEGLIRKTEFLTTTELAKKLKMNVQVITRKVQSGEIEAFKIGKDWRIPEHAIFTWLESQSNKHKKSDDKTKATGQTNLQNGSDSLPNKPSKRKFLLEYILAQFESNKEYSEFDVDQIIKKFNEDHLKVRQEFISEKMMEQVNGSYKRNVSYRMADY